MDGGSSRRYIWSIFSQVCSQGSLHGLQAAFTDSNHRDFRWKIVWRVLFLIFAFIFFMNEVLFLNDVFVIKPTVTDISFEKIQKMHFPDVYVCPPISIEKYENDILGYGYGWFQIFTASLAYSDLFVTITNELRLNITETFIDRSYLEEVYHSGVNKFVRGGGVDGLVKNLEFALNWWKKDLDTIIHKSYMGTMVSVQEAFLLQQLIAYDMKSLFVFFLAENRH